MADFIDLHSIGLRIKQIFEKSGLSASDFCKESGGIPSSTFSQMLNGGTKVNIATINKIVERWGEIYPPFWILFGDDAGKYYRDITVHNSLPATSLEEAVEEEHDSHIQALIDEVVALRTALAQAKPREIDRITVFYSDKNYEVYRPADD